VTGNLSLVREAGVAVVHAPEDEGIVFGEGEDFPGILALADLDRILALTVFEGHYGKQAKSSTGRLNTISLK